MRKQQPTPVDTGTQSTDAGAVQAAGTPGSSWVKYKPKAKTKASGRGKDLVVKISTRLSTRLIQYGHNAFVALEKPGHDIDLAVAKKLWIEAVRELIRDRFTAGAKLPVYDNIDVKSYYGITLDVRKTKKQIQIERLKARLAKLKALVK